MTEITNIKSEMGKDQTAEAKVFGAYLRELRKSQKLNQADIASRIEVTSGYYGFFEQGRKIPSRKILRRLAKVLDTDYFEMLFKAGLDPKKEDYAGDSEEEDDGDEAGQDDGEDLAPSGSADITPDQDSPDQNLPLTASRDGSQGETMQVEGESGVATTSSATDSLVIDQQRLDWAMFCIAHDPTYKLADQFKGEISRDIKVLVVQLYQAQTGRQLLTADESMALSYTLHG